MKRQAGGERRRLSHGIHSDTGVSSAQTPTQSSACCGGGDRRPPGPEESGTDGASVSVFLPEFPPCQSPERDHFQVMLTQNKSLLSENFGGWSIGNTGIASFLCSQVLGFIAKGSYGPIMKVKDNFNKVFAVKVSGQQCKKRIFF